MEVNDLYNEKLYRQFDGGTDHSYFHWINSYCDFESGIVFIGFMIIDHTDIIFDLDECQIYSVYKYFYNNYKYFFLKRFGLVSERLQSLEEDYESFMIRIK